MSAVLYSITPLLLAMGLCAIAKLIYMFLLLDKWQLFEQFKEARMAGPYLHKIRTYPPTVAISYKSWHWDHHYEKKTKRYSDHSKKVEEKHTYVYQETTNETEYLEISHFTDRSEPVFSKDI